MCVIEVMVLLYLEFLLHDIFNIFRDCLLNFVTIPLEARLSRHSMTIIVPLRNKSLVQ